MRHVLIAVVALMAAAWGAFGRLAAPVGIDDKVRTIAAGMAAITPKTMDHGVVLRSVHADGATLVIQFDGMPDWHPTYTNAEMARMLGATLCAHAGVPAIIGEGGRLRLETTTPAGWPLPSMTVDHCD